MDTLEPAERAPENPSTSKTKEGNSMQNEIEGMENAIYTLPCYKGK